MYSLDDGGITADERFVADLAAAVDDGAGRNMTMVSDLCVMFDERAVVDDAVVTPPRRRC